MATDDMTYDLLGGEGGAESVPPGSITSYLLLSVTAALIPALQFGFQISLLNIQNKVIQADLEIESDAIYGLTTSLFPIGALVGALFLAPPIANTCGRRGYFILSSPLFALAGGMMIATWWLKDSNKMAAFIVLVAGRFLAGLGVGGTSVVSPMYISEVSPAAYKGAMASLVQFSITAGILVIEGIAVATGSDWLWILVTATGLAVLQLALAVCASKSPAFLASKGDTPAASLAVQSLQGVGASDGSMIVESISGAKSSSDDKPSLLRLFTSPVYRFPLILCMLFMLAQQFSGINAVFFFSTQFFAKAGVSGNTGSLVAATINIVATGIAVAVIERLGRRVLLLVSTAGMLIFSIGLTVVLKIMDTAHSDALSTLSIVCVGAYVLFFELGLGPIPWLIGAEIFPEAPRATAMSAAAATNWILTFVIAETFPLMHSALGSFSFVPFAGILLVILIYFAFVLPETKGKSPEEVLEAMGMDLSLEPSLRGGRGTDDLEKSGAPGASINPGGRYEDADTTGGSDLYFGGS